MFTTCVHFHSENSITPFSKCTKCDYIDIDMLFSRFRRRHTPDTDYMTASRVIASWLVYANRTLNEAVVPTSQLLHLPMTAAHVEIVFQHENPPDSDWIPVCG